MEFLLCRMVGQKHQERVICQVMAVSEGKAMLITGIDCSRDDLLKAIESVGAYSVVQVLTDNTSTCKAAGKTIETAIV